MSGLGKAEGKGQMFASPSEILPQDLSLRPTQDVLCILTMTVEHSPSLLLLCLPLCPFTHLLYCCENLKQKYMQAPSSTIPLAYTMKPKSIL